MLFQIDYNIVEIKITFFPSGNPTIQKCKRLRKKIETRRELQELDLSNIVEEKGESSQIID
jgi:hypothetical protein